MDKNSIKFYKLHGLGNDYIFFDCISEFMPVDDIIQAVSDLSDRRLGVGGDGVILLLPSEEANIRMRMFNADGGEAEMCGNGVRAIVKLANRLDIIGESATVKTIPGIVEAEVIGEEVKVKMFHPPVISPLQEKTKNGFDFYRAEIGNPHAVIKVEGVPDFEVKTYGKPIENDTALFPDKTNVEFYEEISPGIIRMRVWERGSGETFACGTGACATAAAYRLATGFEHDKVVVRMLGGDLKLSWKGDDFYMQGLATFVYEGSVNLLDLKEKAIVAETKKETKVTAKCTPQ